MCVRWVHQVGFEQINEIFALVCVRLQWTNFTIYAEHQQLPLFKWYPLLFSFNLKISIAFDVFDSNWKIFRYFLFAINAPFLFSLIDDLFSVGNFRELIEYLNGTTDLLSKNGNILDNVLETLDVQQHSLGVLYVLVAKFTNLTVSCKWASIFSYLNIVICNVLYFALIWCDA